MDDEACGCAGQDTACEERAAGKAKDAAGADEAWFWGYKRKEGRAGIRNHVLILPTCACGSESCRIVTSQVKGAVNIVFNTGCSDVQANTDMSQKVLTGFA
ncbi:MAG: UxaA family hydrolase, partial [Lachnospiraceae bacterium]|nr:UxaA family hydrolase [Lachnospiraceae bacterium]